MYVLLNELRKSDKMQGFAEHSISFRNKINNSIMQDQKILNHSFEASLMLQANCLGKNKFKRLTTIVKCAVLLTPVCVGLPSVGPCFVKDRFRGETFFSCTPGKDI